MELLEREEALRELEAALTEAQSGAGRVAVVSGEAGIGKTVLIQNLARAQRANVRVLWGACDALFTPRPLGPVHDMAGQLGGEWPTRLSTETQPAALFASFLTELNQRPTLALFEDVHWADEATLDLLKYIARRIERTAALVVLTYRDDEVGARHPLRTLLGQLATSAFVRRVVLTPLSPQAVRQLIGGRALDTQSLHQQTGGNPFFVTEVIAGGGNGVPPTVRDAVLARAARLSLSGQAVLRAAAIVGPRIEPWVLASITGAEADAADECLNVGMLTAQGEAWAFRHELARQTILETIALPQRMALHRMALDALRAHPSTKTDLTRLAHHAEGASDRDAILQFAPAAARQAMEAKAHHSAAKLFELALRHAEDLPPGQHAKLLDEFATECDTTDRRPEAIEARRQSLQLWPQANQPLEYGRSLTSFALLMQITGHKEEAETANRTALEILEPLAPNTPLLHAYNMEAWLSLASANNQRGAAMAEKGLTLAQHMEDEDVMPRLLEVAGLCTLFLNHEPGLQYLEQALALSLELNHSVRVGNLYANLSSIYVDFHQFTRAAQLYATGTPYVQERELISVWAFMEGWLAILKFHQGQWAEAERIAQQALDRGPMSPGRGPALVALGRLRTRRGQSDALPALDESLEILLKQGFRQREGMLRAARAEAAWHAGDSARTLEEARAGLELAFTHPQPWYVGELAYWLWCAGEKVAVPEWTAKPYALQLARDWRGAAALWEQMGCPYEQARALAEGDIEAQAQALLIFNQLGAQPAAEALRAKMQVAGASIPRGPRATTRENPFGLTTRQSEILALLAQSLTNSEIAARLHLSPKTVDHHITAILTKLNVHSREEAASLYQKFGALKN
ncbi:MAG: AAA family ATPase [Anaerolineales bacterium]|nr:AAA family ATPase [Anaerolineales bacterium]